jgi:hypothetical protein
MNSRRRFRTSETRSSSWCQCCARHQTIATNLPLRQRSVPSLLQTSRRNSGPKKIGSRYWSDSRRNATGHRNWHNCARRKWTKLRLCFRSSHWTHWDENRRNCSSRPDAQSIRASRRKRRRNPELTIVRRRMNPSLRGSNQRESSRRHGHCRRSSASCRLHHLLRGIRHHRETRRPRRRGLRLHAAQTQERAQK